MDNLQEILRDRFKDAGKLAILGAGSFLKADDAAGVMITERLKDRFSGSGITSTGIFTGESAPENYTGEIKKIKPDHLLVIDAADMKKEPGSIFFIQPEEIEGITFSTHMLPVKIMLNYLIQETGCTVTIMGIQPESLDFMGPVKDKVEKAIDLIASVIEEIIIDMERNVNPGFSC